MNNETTIFVGYTSNPDSSSPPVKAFWNEKDAKEWASVRDFIVNIGWCDRCYVPIKIH